MLISEIFFFLWRPYVLLVIFFLYFDPAWIRQKQIWLSSIHVPIILTRTNLPRLRFKKSQP